MFKLVMRTALPLGLLLHCVMVKADTSVNAVTVNFENGTTTFTQGSTGTARYLVKVNSGVVPAGYPLLMSVSSLPTWATQDTASASACTTTTTNCGASISLSAGEYCCLMLNLAGTQLTTGTYSIAPLVGTTPAAYQGQSAPTTVSVTAAPQTTTISISPAANSPQILTADGTTQLVFTITNTDQSTATNIAATQPSGWSGVNIATSPGCTSLAPASNNCTFTLTSSTPNLAKQFTVQGTNTGAAISSPYVAFRINGGLVFSLSGTSPAATAKVVTESDQSASMVWDADLACAQGPNYQCTLQTNAWDISHGQNLQTVPGSTNPGGAGTNGPGDTYQVYDVLEGNNGDTNNPANYAAAVCTTYNSGDSNLNWYLPAICELGTYDSNAGGSDAGCGSSTANIESNLFNYGFLSNLTNAVYYWSSTELSGFPQDYAWYQYFSGIGDSSQYFSAKYGQAGVRCVRAFTY